MADAREQLLWSTLEQFEIRILELVANTVNRKIITLIGCYGQRMETVFSNDKIGDVQTIRTKSL